MSRRENRCLLRIKNAQPEDEAEYKCEVEGDVTACQLKVDGESEHGQTLFGYRVRSVEFTTAYGIHH